MKDSKNSSILCWLRDNQRLRHEAVTLDNLLQQLANLNRYLPPFPKAQAKAARSSWHRLCKPLYALGLLEEDEARFRCLTSEHPTAYRKGFTAVFAADNEIIQEGVSQAGYEVTSQVVKNMRVNRASVALLAASREDTFVPVNLGCQDLNSTNDVSDALYLELETKNLFALQKRFCQTVPHPILEWVVRPNGARNFLKEDALTPAEILHALCCGLSLALVAKILKAPYLIGGEMGIGNTSSSTALAALLLKHPVEDLVGRGAGLSDEGLCQKRSVLKAALEHHHEAKTPLKALAAVGGLDLAALTGFYLGARLLLLPVFLDGLISLTAANLAAKIMPEVVEVFFASHRPREKAGSLLLDQLGLKAPLSLDLALGEGSGGYFYLAILEQAQYLYSSLPSFDEGRVKTYQDFSRRDSNDH